MKKYTICLATLVALSVFAGCGSSSAADEGRAASAQTQEAQNAGHGLVGEAAPKFSVKALTGEDVSVEAKGKPYIINFWATWCPPCQAEIPDLAAFYAAHRETVDFYAVNLQEEAPAVQKFLTERQGAARCAGCKGEGVDALRRACHPDDGRRECRGNRDLP